MSSFSTRRRGLSFANSPEEVLHQTFFTIPALEPRNSLHLSHGRLSPTLPGQFRMNLTTTTSKPGRTPILSAFWTKATSAWVECVLGAQATTSRPLTANATWTDFSPPSSLYRDF